MTAAASLWQEVLQALQNNLSDNPQLLSKVQLLQDALQARDRSDSDYQSLLAAKDADVVRLRAEISRMRHAFTQVTQLNSAHAVEVTALQDQLQQAQASNRATERSAVLQSAVSATSTVHGQLVALQAQLDAQTAALARSEADRAAAAAAASAQVAQLQEQFAAKIADMRRVHREALAAVEAQALAAAGAGAEAALRSAQEEASSARQQASAAQDQVMALEARLQAQQASVSQLSSQVEEQAAALAEMQTARDAALRRAVMAETDAKRAHAECEDLREQVAVAARGDGGAGRVGTDTAIAAARTGQGGAGPSAAELQAMLSMMEGQLQRLSELVRSRDTEVAELRRVVQAGCEERRELSRQLEAVAGQQGGGSVTGGLVSTQGSQATLLGGQHHSSPRSPTGGGVAAPGKLGAAGGLGNGKPYRTGLLSKPKFK